MTTRLILDRVHDVNLAFNPATRQWEYSANERYVGPLSSKEVKFLLDNLEEYFTDPDYFNK